MTFEEIPLYLAVHRLREANYSLVADPVTERQRQAVIRSLTVSLMSTERECCYTADQMLTAWTRFRKGVKVNTLIIGVMLLSGRHQCFYAGRGLGDCDGDVHFDHIIPRSQGGPDVSANGVLACRFHNCQRGNRSLGEYLQTSAHFE